jgi:hypothetical protein
LTTGRYQIDKVQDSCVRRRDVQGFDSFTKFAGCETAELRQQECSARWSTRGFHRKKLILAFLTKNAIDKSNRS